MVRFFLIPYSKYIDSTVSSYWYSSSHDACVRVFWIPSLGTTITRSAYTSFPSPPFPSLFPSPTLPGPLYWTGMTVEKYPAILEAAEPRPRQKWSIAEVRSIFLLYLSVFFFCFIIRSLGFKRYWSLRRHRLLVECLNIPHCKTVYKRERGFVRS